MSNHADAPLREAQTQQALAPLAEDTEYTIDLAELFYRLLAAWKSISATLILFVCSAILITHFLITPMYEAKSTIYIVGNRDSAINLSDLQIGAALTEDYIKVFDMWEVHEEVISNLNLNYNYRQLQKMLKVRNDKGTRMLDLVVQSPFPQEAADIANEYAKVAIGFIEDTMSTEKPNVMSVALKPLVPASPSFTTNTVLAAFLALALSLGVTALRMLADDKLKTADDIAKYTGLTTLAVVPVESYDARAPKKDKRNRNAKRAKSRAGSRRSA